MTSANYYLYYIAVYKLYKSTGLLRLMIHKPDFTIKVQYMSLISLKRSFLNEIISATLRNVLLWPSATCLSQFAHWVQ